MRPAGFRPRIGVRGMLSIAGMTNWGANLREPPMFVPIAHAGWCRHTKVCKAGVVVWYSELARRILPRPTPTPAGDKPPRYIF